MRSILLCFHCFIVLKCVQTNQNSETILAEIVTLNHGGQIQGRELRSQRNNVYYAYQEIPYAAPPIKDLRFKEPKEAEPWKGVLKTVENTKICTQLYQNDPRETEDCLYLNVYTPNNPKTIGSLLPVYFYIHGGIFYSDDGSFKSYSPKFLMDYEIIVVTMNYRLGAFGFLSTEDEIVPGNFGLKDQNLALQWVQNNIHLFGGDPKKVTIGGLSAGAGSVGYHILSKKSEGLFRSAIQQSGSPLCSKMFAKHPKYFAYKLGQCIRNGLDENISSAELLKILSSVGADVIKNCSDIPIPENMRNAVGNEANTVWNPVEEYHSNGFVRNPMHENFKNGDFNHVSLLIGFSSEEELDYDLDELKPKAKYFDNGATHLINGNLNISKQNKLPAGTKLKKVYTSTTFEEDFPAFVRFISDAKYTTGVIREAELVSKYADVYMYQFSYDGSLGGINKTIPGVGHGEENNYIFSNSFNDDIDSFPESDRNVQELMLKMWTNFVKYLNPIPETDCQLKNYKWPTVKDKHLVYQNISDKLNLATNPRNYSKIREIYDEFAEPYQYTY